MFVKQRICLKIYSMLSHKKGIIFGIVDRVILISHPDFHKRNFDHIIRILLDNLSIKDYPLKLIFDNVLIKNQDIN